MHRLTTLTILLASLFAALRLAPADERLSVPPPEKRRESVELVHDVFRSDFANAKTNEQKAALARKLLTEARTVGDPHNLFAILAEATRLAEEAGAVPTMMDTIDYVAGQFVVDGINAKSSALWRLSKSTRSTEVRKAVLQATEDVIRDAMAAERFDVAEKLCSFATDTGRKARLWQNVKRVVALNKELERCQAEFQAVKDALSTLETDPTNASANRVAGTHFCFRKQDWDRGIPMLAFADDPDLKAIAKLELQQAKTPEQQVKLGDSWWRFSETAHDHVKTLARKRAAEPYAAALVSLTGLEKKRVQQKLNEIQTSIAAEHATSGISPSHARRPVAKPQALPLFDSAKHWKITRGTPDHFRFGGRNIVRLSIGNDSGEAELATRLPEGYVLHTISANIRYTKPVDMDIAGIGIGDRRIELYRRDGNRITFRNMDQSAKSVPVELLIGIAYNVTLTLDVNASTTEEQVYSLAFNGKQTHNNLRFGSAWVTLYAKESEADFQLTALTAIDKAVLKKKE